MPGPGAVEVHLQLGPDAQWVPESVPVRAVRRDAGGTVTDVILDVSGMAWFERLLLQLGPAVRVVSPPELAGLRRGGGAAGCWHATRAVASRHERYERFQPWRHRRVPCQPRQGRRRIRRGPRGAADDHRRQVGEEAAEPARRAGRGRHPLRVRLQGGGAYQPGLVPQPGGQSRGRGRVRRRPLHRDRRPDHLGTGAGPPLRSAGGGAARASATTRRRRRG